jgi:hypothetical protein
MVEFSGIGTDQQNNPIGFMNVLGLRATSSALSSVTPLVPFYYISTSYGTGGTNQQN